MPAVRAARWGNFHSESLWNPQGELESRCIRASLKLCSPTASDRPFARKAL